MDYYFQDEKKVCQAKECEQHPAHYLVSEPCKQEINGTTHILVSCEMNERYPRDILPEEAYWYGEHKETSRTTSSTEGTCIDDLLLKQPEKDDVFNILKQRSADWKAFARALNVDDNFSKSLQRQGIVSNDDDKLEEMLKHWIESQCSDVTWQKIFDVLRELKLNNIAADLKMFLQKDDIMQKYKNKADFTAFTL